MTQQERNQKLLEWEEELSYQHKKLIEHFCEKRRRILLEQGPLFCVGSVVLILTSGNGTTARVNKQRLGDTGLGMEWEYRVERPLLSSNWVESWWKESELHLTTATLKTRKSKQDGLSKTWTRDKLLALETLRNLTKQSQKETQE